MKYRTSRSIFGEGTRRGGYAFTAGFSACLAPRFVRKALDRGSRLDGYPVLARVVGVKA